MDVIHWDELNSLAVMLRLTTARCSSSSRRELPGTILPCVTPTYGSMPMKKPSERVPEGVNEGLANFLINRQAGEGEPRSTMS